MTKTTITTSNNYQLIPLIIPDNCMPNIESKLESCDQSILFIPVVELNENSDLIIVLDRERVQFCKIFETNGTKNVLANIDSKLWNAFDKNMCIVPLIYNELFIGLTFANKYIEPDEHYNYVMVDNLLYLNKSDMILYLPKFYENCDIDVVKLDE